MHMKVDMDSRGMKAIGWLHIKEDRRCEVSMEKPRFLLAREESEKPIFNIAFSRLRRP